MNDESKSTSSAGIKSVKVPSVPIGMFHVTSSPIETVISTVPLIIDAPSESAPAWWSTRVKSVHSVLRSTHPPSAISMSNVAPVATVASSKPIATPPPFSSASACVTTTIHCPGAMSAFHVSTPSATVLESVTGSRTASNVGYKTIVAPSKREASLMSVTFPETATLPAMTSMSCDSGLFSTG